VKEVSQEAEPAREKTAAIWRRIFAENGNRDGAVLMMKGAAHGQWLGEADGFPDLVRSPGYHPDYWPALDAFLRRYVTSGAARRGSS
jgi:hypothetical protein